MQDAVNDDRHQLVVAQLKNLRDKLLDLSNRNRLLSFKHSDRARTHIRVIDELPDVLFQKLVDGDRLAFKALPEPESEPEDEKTPEFLVELEAARQTDEAYRESMREVDPDDTSSREAAIAQRQLRDMVRSKLGMSEWVDESLMTKADFSRQKGLEPTYDLPHPSDVGDDPEKHLDNEIQTLLFPKEMDRKLGGILDQSNTMRSEMGIETLRAAFGFLEWQEAKYSEKRHLAPLLLLSIEMERKTSQPWRKYWLKSQNAEFEANKTLEIRLKRDFGFELPMFEEEDTPERYLERVANAVEARANWRVRRFVTVGNFGFSKLPMYNDLEPDSKTVSGNPVIGDLLLGTDNPDDQIFSAPDYEIDTDEVDEKEICLIADADASQHSAIFDVLEGKNIVIKGPPGTGKTQTITNIIAASLSSGKRVLFVAEKIAALDAVYKRLRDARLGDFCLNLHSNRASKKAVLGSFKQRIDLQGKIQHPREYQSRLQELKDNRDRLNRYAYEMNSEIGSLDMTVQEVFWAEQRARELSSKSFDQVKSIGVGDVEQITISELNQARQIIEIAFERRLQMEGDFGNVNAHPWCWVKNTSMNPFEVDETKETVRSWLATTKAILEVAEAVNTQTNCRLIVTIADVIALCNIAPRLPDPPSTTTIGLLKQLREEETRAIVARFAAVLEPFGSNAEDEKEHSIVVNGVVPLQRDWVELSNDILRSVGTLTKIFLDAKCPADAKRELNELEDAAIQIAHLTTLVSAVESVAKIQIPKDSLAELNNAVRVITLLTSTSREILLRRNSYSIKEAARPIILRAQRMCDKIREMTRQLEQQFDFHQLPDINTVSKTASVLRASKKFNFLNKEVSSAKQYFRSIAIGKEKLSAHEMGSRLNVLAKYISLKSELAGDAQITSICDTWFEQETTDLEPFKLLSDWADRVRAEMLPVGDIAPVLRDLLLCGEIEALDQLSAHSPSLSAHSPSPEELSRLEGVLSDIRTGNDLGQIKDALSRKIAHLLDELTNIEDLGISIQAPFDRINQFATLLAELNSSRLAIQEFNGSTELPVADLNLILNYVSELTRLECPESLIDCLCDDQTKDRTDAIRNFSERLSELLEVESTGRGLIASKAGIDESSLFGFEDLLEQDIPLLVERAEYSLENDETLAQWIDYLRTISTDRFEGLSDLLGILIDLPISAENAVATYDRMVFSRIARCAYERCPELVEFDGLSLNKARSEFQKIDKEIFSYARKKLIADLCHVSIPGGKGHGRKSEYTDLSLIQHQLTLRRNIPVRSLVRRASGAILAMKPCLMMSPLSVATYLPKGSFEFDLVVFDEASQMMPADSVGAIIRAKQCVIVGDPQQLPPTSFFKRFEDASEDDDYDEDEAVDAESILDLALNVLRPPRELRWHYRSKHHSLIAFSNKHFYDNNLTVFPSPFEQNERLGVEYIKVDGTYEARSNPKEAVAIAEWATEFMWRFPKRSLGIVALNQVQRDLIFDEMDRRFNQDRIAEEYRANWDPTLTPFFVKNLENVQGDERDVIAISTVYGPGNDGKQRQYFGPISQKNGERRLNVLFTRSREKTVVFSSMRPEQILLRETTPLGTRILRGYLDYALTGRIDAGKNTNRPPDSDFEISVANKLESLGYEAVPQVGVAGYFIDLGVRHPDFPGQYLVGIECDGATYHSSKSARDRDRLREEVLLGQGWKLYRIWSTDWFENPQREVEKLKNFVEREAAVRRDQFENRSESYETIEDSLEKNNGREVAPYDNGTEAFVAQFSEEQTMTNEASELDNSSHPLSMSQNPPDGEEEQSLGVSNSAKTEIVQIDDIVTFHYEEDPANQLTFSIVRENYDPEQGTISPYTVIGSALIEGAVGEEIEVTLQNTSRTLVIDSIEKPSVDNGTDELEPTLDTANAGETDDVTPNGDYEAGSEPPVRNESVTPDNSMIGPKPKSVGVSMVAYREWQPVPVPDPRKSNHAQVARHLRSIIEVEGPIFVPRAYRLYCQACGVARVGRELRSSLNKALYQLIRGREIECDTPEGKKGYGDSVVRVVGSPPAVVRERGPRDFWEIPRAELVGVISSCHIYLSRGDRESLYRYVIDIYDVKRLTTNIKAALSEITDEISKKYE